MNRLLVLLALAAFTPQIEFTVGTSDTISRYYYEVKLAERGFKAKYGRFTNLTLESLGFFGKRSFIVLNQENLSQGSYYLQPAREIAAFASPFDVHTTNGGDPKKYQDPVKNAIALELSWNTTNENEGYIMVDSVTVISMRDYDPRTKVTKVLLGNMIRKSKAFCGTGELILPTKPAILKECTGKKRYKIRKTAAHLVAVLAA